MNLRLQRHGALRALLLATVPAWAPTYPTRPLRLIVPCPPSCAVDILARPIAQKLAGQLAQPVVIDNRVCAR